MNIYSKKQRWKFALAIVATVIVLVSLWYTNVLVRQIAKGEKEQVEAWATAIQKKASLVNYSKDLYTKIAREEIKRVEIWAEANRRVATAPLNEDPEFYTQILFSNTTIPMILTTEEGDIITSANLPADSSESEAYLQAQLEKMKKKNQLVEINYFEDQKNLLYFDQSTIFSEIKKVMEEQISSLNEDILSNAAAAPTIYTDSTKQRVLEFSNIDSSKMRDPEFVAEKIEQMRSQNVPIKIDLGGGMTRYVFYNDSPLLGQLKIYPYIQLAVIALFLMIAYYLFSTARKSEQNQVWVGMAKETAHQLGTPLSSLLAWMEVLRSKGVDEKTIKEISSDVGRLETITERFSKIGSIPNLEQEDVNQVIDEVLEYLKTRLSKKVEFTHSTSNGKVVECSINVPLLEWVLENVIKNAVDAIGGEGKIHIHVTDQSQFVYIDISDNGKGIPKGKRKTVFEPGYTTKQRGWGLGLSLTKRIVENYHSGKIFVKQSELEKGTTFRIVLNKKVKNGRNIHSYSLL